MAQSSLIIKLGAQVSTAVSGIRSVYTGLDQIVRKVSSLSVMRLGSLVGFVTAGVGITGVTAKILQLGARAETTRLSFQTMLGSIAAGDAMMTRLDRFSNSTPYSGDQVNRAAKTLLGFGIAAGDVESELRKVGDVAAGSGKDFNELAAIYGKVFAKGKSDSEDLNQMVEAGIPIVKLLGEMYGKTGGEIYAMASKGEISAAAISAAFDKMSGNGGVYANMMDQQSKTVSGIWGAIVGQLEYAGSLIGEAIEPLVKSVLTYFQGWADEIVAMCQDGRMVEYLATIAYAAIDTGATIARGLLNVREYGTAAFGALCDIGAAAWYGIQGGAILAFVGIVQALNRAWEQIKAVFTVIGRLASATWNGILAGVSGFWAGVLNLVLNGVNAVIRMLNKIPGVDIDMVEKPAFVKKIERFSAEAGEKARRELEAVATGQDFKEASRRAELKNREWSGVEARGNELTEKSADKMLSAVGRFERAAENVAAGTAAIDDFAQRATDTVSRWQTDAQDKQRERNNATLDREQEKRDLTPSAGPIAKRERQVTDSLTKIGLYNFGPNSVRSIDRERNTLLGDILETVTQINRRSSGLLT